MNPEEISIQQKPVLLDFFAEWCATCQTMMPVLESVKKKLKENLHILEIDIDKNPTVASYYRVKGVPTFILFKKGKELWRRSGLISGKELEEQIRKHDTV